MAAKDGKSKTDDLLEATAQIDVTMEDLGDTSYEKARIIGSRALQLSQGAKPLVKLSQKQMEKIKFNPIDIARKEYEAGVIPISVKRTLPHEL